MGEVPVLWLAFVLACGSKCEEGDCDSESPPDDTSTADDTGDDSGGPDDSSTESGDDSADDSGDDSGPDDSGWTDTPPDCTTPVASFHGADGSVTDLTGAFGAGTFTTLDEPGNLWVCPGTWFTRVILRADIHVIGLGDEPADTILSGGESGTILDVGGPHTYTVENLTLDRGAGLDKSHNSGGGGIFCCGDGTACKIKTGKTRGTVVVDDVVFTNNTGNDGAAFYGLECDFDVRNSFVADNHSDDDGGAVSLWFSTVTLDSVTFERNDGLDGGVMAMFYSSATISNSTFSNNTAGNYSAGIWAAYNSTLEISDTLFENNVNEAIYTSAYGGAIIAFETARLERVRFVDNSAPKGGGVFVYYDAVVNGIECDFSGNEPDDIWAADYSDEGGVSYTAGMDYSFACADNVCTPK
jgi:hypothetical protein